MYTTPYIAVLGGDKREVFLGKALARDNMDVHYVGFEKFHDESDLKKTTLEKALPVSDVLIVSLAGVDETGALNAPYTADTLRLNEKELFSVKPGSLFITGSLPAKMKKYLQTRGVRVIETVDRDDVACLNAIPTAEGAILYALQKSERVLEGASCLVTGFGRCAKALAIRLKGLGVQVSIGARNPASLAEAEMYGYRAVPLTELAEEACRYDFIFNTVPSLLFTAEVLQRAKTAVVIIDVASKPGGVDMAAAKEIPLTVLHVLGIPGKTAPLTAGLILTQVYRKLIHRHFEENYLRKGGEANEA
jgi:dipicolinate synthase subunit A